MSKPLTNTFIATLRGHWFWVSILSAIALMLHYYYYQTQMVMYGGTFIGLSYGLIATIIIGVLMWLGVRRRSYGSGMGTLQGWVTAHVYLGLLTLLLIPMHAGFRFGIDVHTLAFVLLAIVVASGIIGVLLYQYLPSRLTKYESGLQADKIDKEIAQLLADMRKLIKTKSDAMVSLYQAELARVNDLEVSNWSLLFRGSGGDLISQRSKELAGKLPSIPPEDQGSFQLLSQLVLQKTQLESNLLNQMRLRNALQAWLYVHVPVSVAMVVTVGIHLLVVFYY